MAKVTARHTIHRLGAGKGQQQIIKPGEEFEATPDELKELLGAGAIEAPAAPPPAKSTVGGKGGGAAKAPPDP